MSKFNFWTFSFRLIGPVAWIMNVNMVGWGSSIVVWIRFRRYLSDILSGTDLSIDFATNYQKMLECELKIINYVGYFDSKCLDLSALLWKFQKGFFVWLKIGKYLLLSELIQYYIIKSNKLPIKNFHNSILKILKMNRNFNLKVFPKCRFSIVLSNPSLIET